MVTALATHGSTLPDAPAATSSADYSIFRRLILPMLTAQPGLDIYPSVEVGAELEGYRWTAIRRACREHGYEASLQPALPVEWGFVLLPNRTSLHIVLTRICPDHERGPGDDFPNE